MDDTNYFVCTLGQAAPFQHETKLYQTIPEFLSHQSKLSGNAPAIGFPIPRREGHWTYRILTFLDIDAGTQVFAQRLSKRFGLEWRSPQTVALLCHSSPEFLFAWLGLMRLGYSVLLIAPQCQPAAIVHLCESCKVSLLLHDTAHAERVRSAVTLREKGTDSALVSGLIPLEAHEDIFRVIQDSWETSPMDPRVDEADVAYLHHTSGTSSGLPKPIAQTHRAAIGVLPHLPTTPTKATFTTTPLYHGGIADVFRSWTSDSLIWVFPGKDIPITARNVCKCLDIARSCALDGCQPEVKYFSSVPYVLQMMEADDAGLTALKSMDIVGVGGAALPAEVGNRLVARGVNLVSRFGSAECGFILSSYRDFSKDKEWQYLRNYSPAKLVDFEDREDGLAELVVKPGWPHMAKKNREDGSFVTADLFAKHSNIKNTWLYHSRADSQLTLVTGKKFDPAPLEAAIATSQQLDDVLIFGNNRPYPGLLLLRSEKSKAVSEDELIEVVWPLVEELNKDSPDHARLSRNMLIPIPYQSEPLEKSSKGTVVRSVAYARFSALIDAAYDATLDIGLGDVDDAELSHHLLELIREMVPNSIRLTENTDLFSYGVDSIVCMRLRNRLRQLAPSYSKELPLSVVEDSGTVRGLSDYILRKRHGAPDAEHEDEDRLMLDLVKKHSTFGGQISVKTNGHHANGNSGQVVLLTGATGALGAHMLDVLQRSSTVTTIYCLVRGADEKAAKERVCKALEQRGLAGILPEDEHNNKVKIVQAQLGEPHLGLSETMYDHLAANVDLILHIAWTVNFRLKLRSFAHDNLAGVTNLINLALAAGRSQPPRFAYCSSTAATMNAKTDQTATISETISPLPSSASPLGYARSKWVAEQICSEANARTSLRGRVAIVRVGQLSGDSKTGIWNTKEAWPMMLSSSRLIGCLPDLGDEPLDWLPVDIAAEAFVQASQHPINEATEPSVYHVLNPHQTPTWHVMLDWLKKKGDFDLVSPHEWVRRLEQSGNTEHSAMKLLGLWKQSYCNTHTQQKETKRPQFAVAKTQERVPALRDIRPVDEAYMGKIWDWVQANVQ